MTFEGFFDGGLARGVEEQEDFAGAFSVGDDGAKGILAEIVICPVFEAEWATVATAKMCTVCIAQQFEADWNVSGFVVGDTVREAEFVPGNVESRVEFGDEFGDGVKVFVTDAVDEVVDGDRVEVASSAFLDRRSGGRHEDVTL